MKIRFLVNFISTYGPDGWNPESTFLGGTEESVVEWAKRLATEHDVEVYHNGQHGNWDNVEYLDRDDYRGNNGVTVNIKSSEVVPHGKTWYLTNELDVARHNLSKFAGVIFPSRWAMDHLKVSNPNVRIIPHGFDKAAIHNEPKFQNQCLYASSPDRGLDNLLEIWPQVVAAVPDAQLVVTYNGQIDTPNTMCLGKVDDITMNRLYSTSDFWLHPCNGGELYCMSGIKAQYAGAIPVIFPMMALAETVKRGIKCHDNQDFADKLIKVMGDDKWKKQIRGHLKVQDYPDWDTSTRLLAQTILN